MSQRKIRATNPAAREGAGRTRHAPRPLPHPLRPNQDHRREVLRLVVPSYCERHKHTVYRAHNIYHEKCAGAGYPGPTDGTGESGTDEY